MKTINYLTMVIGIAITTMSCADDDKSKSTESTCECYFTLTEGGQEQQNYTEPSDITDCSKDGDWYPYNGFEPSTTVHLELHCNPN